MVGEESDEARHAHEAQRLRLADGEKWLSAAPRPQP
jgi:hypothetical protein